ncbi:MAG: hypothetical protein D8H99_50975 [Streptococcus sp.]|nr:MAG: hypothetical protein D8H99_50975 [Streptococcus sp.]
MTNDLTNTSPQYLPGDSFIGFEKYLEQYGLPTENVIASESERKMMHTMLPSILENMPQEYKTNARYLSKFVAGVAIGLYDASLNFVWNEVMMKIHQKIIHYGVEIFFNSAVSESDRGLYKTEEDLPHLKDRVVLDHCKKLGLISQALYLRLTHILDMRNHVGASHPNDDQIRTAELLGWLQTCIDDVISEKVNGHAITVKSIIDNTKNRDTHFSQVDKEQFENSIKELSPQFIANLTNTLFGIFVSKNYEGKSIILNNFLSLSLISWKYTTDTFRYSLGERLDVFRTQLDEYKINQSELFFEKVGGKKYYSKDLKTIQLSVKCEQLKNAHFSWDNYANETPIAREILELAPSPSDVPNMRKDLLVETFLICRIGKNVSYQRGVSPGGKLFYDRFFQNSDEDIVKRILTLLSDGNINVNGQIQNNNLLEVLNLVPEDMIGAQYMEVLDNLKAFINDGNEAEKYFNTVDFKRFKDNFLVY